MRNPIKIAIGIIVGIVGAILTTTGNLIEYVKHMKKRRKTLEEI